MLKRCYQIRVGNSGVQWRLICQKLMLWPTTLGFSLRRMGFSQFSRDVIHNCIFTLKYSIMIYGATLANFGVILCPRIWLSLLWRAFPYLCFVLIIINCQRRAKRHTLFFADDLWFFCKATLEEIGTLKGILEEFQQVSGQVVN